MGTALLDKHMGIGIAGIYSIHSLFWGHGDVGTAHKDIHMETGISLLTLYTWPIHGDAGTWGIHLYAVSL